MDSAREVRVHMRGRRMFGLVLDEFETASENIA